MSCKINKDSIPQGNGKGFKADGEQTFKSSRYHKAAYAFGITLAISALALLAIGANDPDAAGRCIDTYVKSISLNGSTLDFVAALAPTVALGVATLASIILRIDYRNKKRKTRVREHKKGVVVTLPLRVSGKGGRALAEEERKVQHEAVEQANSLNKGLNDFAKEAQQFFVQYKGSQKEKPNYISLAGMDEVEALIIRTNLSLALKHVGHEDSGSFIEKAQSTKALLLALGAIRNPNHVVDFKKEQEAMGDQWEPWLAFVREVTPGIEVNCMLSKTLKQVQGESAGIRETIKKRRA
ncbi:hypothetical protein SCG7109_AI_00210 [Chlamydiales bacterium SCGC AG-110-M15]|nr:hypothetical protein SCG7109_AI_00210 [Chlamydiales bacterium SCGC AG-110-M15]